MQIGKLLSFFRSHIAIQSQQSGKWTFYVHYNLPWKMVASVSLHVMNLQIKMRYLLSTVMLGLPFPFLHIAKLNYLQKPQMVTRANFPGLSMQYGGRSFLSPHQVQPSPSAFYRVSWLSAIGEEILLVFLMMRELLWEDIDREKVNLISFSTSIIIFCFLDETTVVVYNVSLFRGLSWCRADLSLP